MPAKRRSMLCCLGGADETPEIVVDNNMILQTIKEEDPMPPLDELNAKFEELVEELDLVAQHKERMFSLSPEKKWQIYCSKKRVSLKYMYLVSSK
ncbi:disheveled-associated activator of morphogenesis 2-like [Lytechinus pictus]|uniref:disheveled-associated activator of morphogenesis 2-like n=1 Tax=Lytechinus pictus TaxID=7653 RepID=UPI00240E5A09|nr:disheveled-associated activator of morphogenesis 2-like [Lytechinus pictus]